MNKLLVVRQHSLAKEKFVSNGLQKDVHVVVKNSPFQIDLGLSEWDAGLTTFADVAVVAKLMFDTEEEREVVFIKRKPLEFKAQLSDDGKVMTCEVRLKVLSSQLEDMHFRIHFAAVWKESRMAVEGMCALSEPIKVVSKPEQVEKIQRGESMGAGAKAPARSRKRKQTDHSEMLQRIEKEQQRQREMLRKLLEREGGGAASIAAELNGDAMETNQSAAKQDFTSAFEQLIAAYKALGPEERPTKIRRIISATPVRDVSAINEMFDHFQYELRRGDDGDQFAGSVVGQFQPEYSFQEGIEQFDLSLFSKEYIPVPTTGGEMQQ